jgi:hypothetical protein
MTTVNGKAGMMEEVDRTTPTSAGAAATDLERELSRARDQLAFYESFDRLIQENVARSGELLREAQAERERAAHDIAASRADLDRRLAVGREQQRSTLAAIRDDLQRIHEQVSTLAQRVDEALSTLDNAPPLNDPGETSPAASDPSPIASTIGSPATPPTPPTAWVPPVERGDVLFSPLSSTRSAGSPAPGLPDTSSDSAPIEKVSPAHRMGDLNGGTAIIVPPATDHPDSPRSTPGRLIAPDAARTESPSTLPHVTMVLVHGVPRAATALSLQRHLAALDHVESVEAREYAEGILRLQVVASPPLRLDDITRWEAAPGLEPLHVLDDVIEVRLPGAIGR